MTDMTDPSPHQIADSSLVRERVLTHPPAQKERQKLARATNSSRSRATSTLPVATTAAAATATRTRQTDLNQTNSTAQHSTQTDGRTDVEPLVYFFSWRVWTVLRTSLGKTSIRGKVKYHQDNQPFIHSSSGGAGSLRIAEKRSGKSDR